MVWRFSLTGWLRMPHAIRLKVGTNEIHVESESRADCEALFDQAMAHIGDVGAAGSAVSEPVVIPTNREPDAGPLPPGLEPLRELATHAQISLDDLQRIVSIKDPAAPRLVVRLTDAERAGRQRKAAAIIMAVSKRTANKIEWPVFQLVKALEASLVDATELSRGLAEGEGTSRFGKTGVRAGTKYFLEVKGEDLAIETLRELAPLVRFVPANGSPSGGSPPANIPAVSQ